MVQFIWKYVWGQFSQTSDLVTLTYFLRLALGNILATSWYAPCFLKLTSHTPQVRTSSQMHSHVRHSGGKFRRGSQLLSQWSDFVMVIISTLWLSYNICHVGAMATFWSFFSDIRRLGLGLGSVQTTGRNREFLLFVIYKHTDCLVGFFPHHPAAEVISWLMATSGVQKRKIEHLLGHA